MGNRGIFDEDIRLAKLSELGDSLVKLNRVINWEMFRPLLEEATRKEKKGAGGRPPFDCVLMFKVLVLQRIYNLSDDQTEYQINDRMSFMRFLGLDRVSRNSQMVFASGTRSSKPNPKKRIKLIRSLIWYSVWSSLRL